MLQLPAHGIGQLARMLLVLAEKCSFAVFSSVPSARYCQCECDEWWLAWCCSWLQQLNNAVAIYSNGVVYLYFICVLSVVKPPEMELICSVSRVLMTKEHCHMTVL